MSLGCHGATDLARELQPQWLRLIYNSNCRGLTNCRQASVPLRRNTNEHGDDDPQIPDIRLLSHIPYGGIHSHPGKGFHASLSYDDDDVKQLACGTKDYLRYVIGIRMIAIIQYMLNYIIKYYIFGLFLRVHIDKHHYTIVPTGPLPYLPLLSSESPGI